jgi:ELWxxDGT repeat protein
VYRTDGTAAGTYLLRQLQNATRFVVVAGLAYFLARDGTSGATVLWKSDGTSGGTSLVADAANPGGFALSNASSFAACQGKLFFGTIGGDLYVTDGTDAGTTFVADVTPAGYLTARGFAAAGGKLVFVVRQSTGSQFYRLWESDGTAAGTRQLSDTVSFTVVPTWATTADAAFVVGKRDDQPQSGSILFAVDARGLTQVRAFGSTGYVGYWGPSIGSTQYFSASDGVHGSELWRTDGTADGTFMIKDVNPGSGDGLYNVFGRCGDVLLFSADDPAHGFELFRSDGRYGSMELLADIMPGTSSSNTGFYTSMGDSIYFAATDAMHGAQLWAYTPEFAEVAADGTLLVSGSAGDDSISVTRNGSTLDVTCNGAARSFPASSVGSVLISAFGGDDQIEVGGPLATACAVHGGGGNDTLTVTSGTFDFGSDAGLGSDHLTLNVAAGASVTFTARQHLESLDVAGVAVAAAGGGSPIVTRQLSATGAGRIDLNDNDLILDYGAASALETLQALINTARNGGSWTGNGLTSSIARTNAAHNTTLGAMEASDFKSIYGAGALFDGETIDTTAVLVKYTYYGDADFNGRVNFDDYVRTDSGFNNHRTGWLNGDFDGNGVINFDDYVLIDLAFNTQSGVLGRSASARSPKAGTRLR